MSQLLHSASGFEPIPNVQPRLACLERAARTFSVAQNHKRPLCHASGLISAAGWTWSETLVSSRTPGVYCFNTTAGLTGALTLDGRGDSEAAWIFQLGSALTTATGSSVVMAGSGKASNVFWQVGSSATLGTGTKFRGNLLALASVTLVSGTELRGRALALNAAVTLDHNDVALP